MWAPDGRTVYFHTRDEANLMAAKVIGTEPTFTTGTPEVLFDVDDDMSIEDVAPDGRFFGREAVSDAGDDAVDAIAQLHIMLVLNWFEELRERADSGR